MSVKLYSGYERTSREKLPEDGVKIDKNSALGLSTLAAVMKCQRTGNYEGIANALSLHNCVSIQEDGTEHKEKVDEREVYVITDGNISKDVRNVKALELLLKSGWTLSDTRVEDVEV